MVKLSNRQDNSCTAPYAFYKCSKGPFVGCCSVDPCATGVCPDQNQDASSVASEAKPTTLSADVEPSLSVSVLTVDQTATLSMSSPATTIDPTIISSVSEHNSLLTSSQGKSTNIFGLTSPSVQKTANSFLTTTSSSSSTPSSAFLPTYSASSPTSLVNPNSNKNTSSSNISAARTGGIAAGIGTLVVIIVGILLCCIWCQKRKERRKGGPRTMRADERAIKDNTATHHHDIGETASLCKDPLEQGQVRDNATAATITTGSPPEYRPLSSSSMSQLPSELPGCTPNYTNITITDPKVGFGSRYERQNALNSIADSSSRSDTVESTLPSSTQQQKAAVDDCTNLQNSNSRTLTMLARQRRLVLGYGSRQHRQYHHQKPLMARKLQNQRQEFHETTQVRIPPKSTGGGHGGETELPG